MNEAKFQSFFGKMLRAVGSGIIEEINHRVLGTLNVRQACMELKITKTNTLPFSEVKPHQLEALRNVRDGGLFYKISDASMDFKPFDCFMAHGPAYIVIWYYEERGSKHCFFVPIQVWDKIIEGKTRGSLSRQEAMTLVKGGSAALVDFESGILL